MPEYSISLKHKGALNFNLDASMKRKSITFKYPNSIADGEISFTQTTDKNSQLGTSASLTKEIMDKQMIFKGSLNYTGSDDYIKRKRNAALKMTIKNTPKISGEITTTYDWTKKTDTFLQIQSSLCTSFLNPFIVGISSTSKMKQVNGSLDVDRANSSISTFIQIKRNDYVTAISWFVKIFYVKFFLYILIIIISLIANQKKNNLTFIIIKKYYLIGNNVNLE